MYLLFKDNADSRDNKAGAWVPTSALNTLSLLVLLSLTMVFGGCAKQGYPSGGPKDTEAPKSVGCKPQNETRNFDRKQFYVEFDEYVVLKDADNNVLVSPPLKNKAEYSTKGHGVQVKIKDTLQENTTYLFQFKEAIADYNEGNVLPSFEYVFSTGDAMDTMMLAGRVLGARDGKPWKETLTVMAYRQENCPTDTMALSQQPDLVTRCDKDGWFAFHYIPGGRYRLVALEDKDRNLRVGSSEAVAFDTSFLAAVDSVDSSAMVTLRVSAPDRRQQRVLKSEFAERGIIRIVTLLPMQTPQVAGEDVVWRLNERRDTMTVWCINEKCDSTVLVVSDSPMELRDTIKLRYRAPQRASSRRRQRETTPNKEPDIRPLCQGSNGFYDDLRLAFRVPVTTLRDSAMAEVMLVKDSSVQRCPIALDSSGLVARVEASLVSGKQYKMTLRDSLFTDIYGHSYDSLSFNLTPKDYGTLTVHVTNTMGCQLVVEVLDSKDTVLQSQIVEGASGTLRFVHLPAAEYRLRAVVDRDGDGRWTTGDYLQQRQPESFILYGKTLQLREKWEMEERWTVEEVEETKMDTDSGAHGAKRGRRGVKDNQ